MNGAGQNVKCEPHYRRSAPQSTMTNDTKKECICESCTVGPKGGCKCWCHTTPLENKCCEKCVRGTKEAPFCGLRDECVCHDSDCCDKCRITKDILDAQIYSCNAYYTDCPCHQPKDNGWDEWWDKVWYETRNGHSCVGRLTLSKIVQEKLTQVEKEAEERGERQFLS